jgi:hypothetical protein
MGEREWRRAHRQQQQEQQQQQEEELGYEQTGGRESRQRRLEMHWAVPNSAAAGSC